MTKIRHLEVLTPQFKRLSLTIYMQLKPVFKRKLGAPFKVPLVAQIILALFKLKYNLPDRVLEHLFNIDHVTISRIILRVSKAIADLNIHLKTKDAEYYIVDSTTIKIGKGSTDKTFTGYKHYHGVKYQVIINDTQDICMVSDVYAASIHDKKIFDLEYEKLKSKIDNSLTILGDKAYMGLETSNVKTPIRRNSRFYKDHTKIAKSNNAEFSAKRVRIENLFAWLKHYRILKQACYYAVSKVTIFFKAITNIYSLSQLTT